VALPAAWTESTLLEAVENEVQSVSAVLQLVSPSTALETAVNFDVPAVLGVASVEDVDYDGVADVVKVFTIAKWKAWQKAFDSAVALFDVKTASLDAKQSQIFKQVSSRLAAAETDALRYPEVVDSQSGTIGFAMVSGTATLGSPYRYAPDEFGA